MIRRLATVSIALLVSVGTVSSQETIAVGKEAPDFELSDSKGRSYKLSSYRGQKPVVLEFFRSGDW